jgi:hypothetical protein
MTDRVPLKGTNTPRMHRRPLQTVLAWLCLSAFWLSHTVIAGNLVVCRDMHGGSRVEWGCGKSASGECRPPSAQGEHSDERAEPGPCEDIPVQAELQIAKTLSRSTDQLIASALTLVAVRTPDLFPFRTAAHITPVVAPDRPPDALCRIRTVVLLV